MPSDSISVWMIAGILIIILGFAALVGQSVRRSNGIKRSFFASPYTLWMILFTIVPVLLISYYAFTDANGAFTLDNFRTSGTAITPSTSFTARWGRSTRC